MSISSRTLIPVLLHQASEISSLVQQTASSEIYWRVIFCTWTNRSHHPAVPIILTSLCSSCPCNRSLIPERRALLPVCCIHYESLIIVHTICSLTGRQRHFINYQSHFLLFLPFPGGQGEQCSASSYCHKLALWSTCNMMSQGGEGIRWQDTFKRNCVMLLEGLLMHIASSGQTFEVLQAGKVISLDNDCIAYQNVGLILRSPYSGAQFQSKCSELLPIQFPIHSQLSLQQECPHINCPPCWEITAPVVTPLSHSQPLNMHHHIMFLKHPTAFVPSSQSSWCVQNIACNPVSVTGMAHIIPQMAVQCVLKLSWGCAVKPVLRC